MSQDRVQSMRDAVAQLMPEIRGNLERLVRIPSVSFAGFDPAEVERSCQETIDILTAAGMQTQVLRVVRVEPGEVSVLAPIRER